MHIGGSLDVMFLRLLYVTYISCFYMFHLTVYRYFSVSIHER